jgi:hypothetical protein
VGGSCLWSPARMSFLPFNSYGNKINQHLAWGRVYRHTGMKQAASRACAASSTTTTSNSGACRRILSSAYTKYRYNVEQET